MTFVFVTMVAASAACTAPRARFSQAFQSPWLRGDSREFYNERAFHGDDLAVLRSRRRVARVAMIPPTQSEEADRPVRTQSPQAVYRPSAPFPTYSKAPHANHVLTPLEDTVRRRNRIVAHARALVGGRFKDSTAFVRQVYVDAGIDLVGWSGRPVVGSPVKAIYLYALSQNGVHYLPRPSGADVVFFHNTRDANSDGRSNDWLSQVGVVEEVDADDTISVVTVVRGRVTRIAMNLRKPSVPRDRSSMRIVNTELRRRRPTDAPRLGTLSGQLFAGFGRIVP